MCEKNQPHRDRTKRFVQHDAALRRRRDQNEFDGQGGDAFRRAGVVFLMAWGHRLSGAGGRGDAIWLPLAQRDPSRAYVDSVLERGACGGKPLCPCGMAAPRPGSARHAWDRRFPGEDTIRRLFHQFSQGRIEAFWRPLWVWLLGLLREPEGGFTLDLDSTIFSREGSQQGAAKGYNPRRPGRKSHHPILAVLAEAPFVLHAWLRSGNTSAGRGVAAFLSEAFVPFARRLAPAKRAGRQRLL
jgi:hypothetical protein